MKLLLLPKYSKEGPSSRYRTFLYKKSLSKVFNIECHPLFDREYYEERFTIKNKISLAFFVVKYYSKRFFWLYSNIYKYDVVFLEKEFFPYLPFLFEKIILAKAKKLIVDYDDAIFHNYDMGNRIKVALLGNKIPRLLKEANSVITGSPYLTNFVKQFNKNVIEIPTSLDSKIYKVEVQKPKDRFVVCWIGSKTTSKYILGILDSLKAFQKQKPNVLYKLIGFDQSLSSYLSGIEYEIINWSEKSEAREIASSHMGIMPLDESSFAKGKCGFKQIQYMAAGIPFIASPLEANLKIDKNKNNLFAKNNKEWLINFEKIYSTYEHFELVGEQNRSIVEKYYSLDANSPKLLKILKLEQSY